MTRIPKKPALKGKTAKPQPRVLVHRSLGSCTVVGIFLTDAGSIVADVDLAGVRRTLSLDPQFWLSDISTLALEAVKRKPVKPEAEAAEPAGAADEDAAEPEEAELALNVDGHIDDGDQPETETDADAEALELVE